MNSLKCTWSRDTIDKGNKYFKYNQRDVPVIFHFVMISHTARVTLIKASPRSAQLQMKAESILSTGSSVNVLDLIKVLDTFLVNCFLCCCIKQKKRKRQKKSYWYQRRHILMSRAHSVVDTYCIFSARMISYPRVPSMLTVRQDDNETCLSVRRSLRV